MGFFDSITKPFEKALGAAQNALGDIGGNLGLEGVLNTFIPGLGTVGTALGGEIPIGGSVGAAATGAGLLGAPIGGFGAGAGGGGFGAGVGGGGFGAGVGGGGFGAGAGGGGFGAGVGGASSRAKLFGGGGILGTGIGPDVGPNLNILGGGDGGSGDLFGGTVPGFPSIAQPSSLSNIISESLFTTDGEDSFTDKLLGGFLRGIPGAVGAGAVGLGQYFNNKETIQAARDIAQLHEDAANARQLQQLGFDREQLNKTLEFNRRSLIANLALTVAKAKLEAEIERRRQIQTAFSNAMQTALQGAQLTSSASANLGTIGQRAALGG